MRDSSALNSLASLLNPLLTMVDVGCRWGPSGGWTSLEPYLNLVGFDADPVECAALERQFPNPRYRFIPLALGPVAGRRTLYLTAEPACSSLFPPDPVVIQNRPSLALASQTGTQAVDVVTLDDWLRTASCGPVDFMKVDAQGSELGILEGASKALETTLAVEVEVEFNPIYQGQPLFGDVDRYLREKGFLLWRLKDLTHYSLPGGISNYEQQDQQYFDGPPPAPFAARGGQLYWANAFYVKKGLAYESGLEAMQLVRAVCVMEMLGFWDLAQSLARMAFPAVGIELRAPLQRFID